MTAPEMPSYKSERWLKQMGWEAGKGLGRNEDGMSDYIKVSKKTDSYGIGGSLLTERDRQGFGWWDNLYNKAASSVQVDPASAPTAKPNTSTAKPMTTNYGAPSFVKAEDKYQTLASDKKAKGEAAEEEDEEVKPQQKYSLYGGAFVSGGAFVLGSSKDGPSDSSDSDSDDSSDEEKSYASGLNENDLLAVCGGRILSQWKYPAQGRAKRLAEHERQWKENRDREQALEKEKAEMEQKGEATEAEAKTSNDKTKEEDKAASEDEDQTKEERKRKRKEKKEKKKAKKEKREKKKKEGLETKVSKKRKREEEEEDEEPEEKEEKKLKKKKKKSKSKKVKKSDDTKADKKDKRKKKDEKKKSKRNKNKNKSE